MITIAFDYQQKTGTLRMTMDGHAGAGKKGSDLVCASATMLAYTLAQAVQELYRSGLLKRKPRLCLHDGWADIIATPRLLGQAESLMAFWTVQAGARILHSNFPGCVQLTPLRLPEEEG